MRTPSVHIGLLVLIGTGAIFSAPVSDADRASSSVEELAVVNYGTDGPVAVTTHIENSAGDKLDYNGAHFFGRDSEKHDFNRQAHVKLEHVRTQDPHLRRFLGKSIVKREGPYPPAVVPPTHYEPPTTTTTTTTTTEAPPTTPTPGVPHEEYGVPPGLGLEPVPCVPKSWDEGSDCVYTQLSPVLPPVEDRVMLWGGEDFSGNNLQEPTGTSLYELNELVGNQFGDGQEEPVDALPSVGSSGCTDCNFSQLPELPELVYPSVQSNPSTVTLPPLLPEPVPVPQEPQVQDCGQKFFVRTRPFQGAEKTVPSEEYGDVGLVDLRLMDERKQKPDVLSTHSQVILVRDMESYPVLKAKVDRTPASRHTKLGQRGSVRFGHTFLKDTTGRDQDQVDGLTGGQPVDGGQFVLCTVDCYALEEKVPAPETPAMEIPSDGRLW